MKTNGRSRCGHSRVKQTRSRQQASREQHDKILVVCEGSKTEPNYFYGLRRSLKHNKRRVVITGKGGSSPSDVFDLACQHYQESEEANDKFDKVYCVFDKNSHQDYKQVLSKIKNMVPSDVFKSINSVPSFEYFLLLHYKKTTKPFTSQQALTALKKYIPKYKKGDKNIFSVVCGRVEDAKRNAVQALTAAEQNNTDNPTTRAHELVEFMENIK